MIATAPSSGLTNRLSVEEFLDFANAPENESRHWELVRGIVTEMPSPTQYHGLVCAYVVFELKTYARSIRRGYVSSNDAGILVEQSPDTLRGPDVAYFAEPLTSQDVSRKYTDVAPLIVFEILSPDDRPGRVTAKIRDYLEMGVKIVCVVDCEERTVTVYRPNRSFEILTAEQTFLAGAEAPGLSFPINSLFLTDTER